VIRENRRPLLAFALVATMCAASLAQGVRSEALQGFVAAQVPQLVVAGAQILPKDEARVAPMSRQEPAAVPTPVAGESDEQTDVGTEKGKRARKDGTPRRPPAHARTPGRPDHSLTPGRPDHAHGQRSHSGGPRERSAQPPGHHRKAERGTRPGHRGRHHRDHRPPAHAKAHDKAHGKGSTSGMGKD
jgi:hypothetical protein